MDHIFIENIKKLLKIAIPSYVCKETGFVAVLTCLLVLRTYMSIWLADVNGGIVKSIVNKNFQEFVRRVLYWILMWCR